jgi:hypothetical protein
MTDGVLVWHQVKRQQASGPWTITSLVSKNVIVPWWPKISSGSRLVFVSSTSARELAELVERACAAESWQVFDAHFLTAPNRDRFERVRQAWGDQAGADVYAALRRIDVRNIGEPDLTDLLEARLGALVDGLPQTAMAVLEQFIDDSTHQILTAPAVWERLAEHGLRPLTRAGAGTDAGGHGRYARVTQRAEGSGNAAITQVAGDYITIQASGSARRARGRRQQTGRARIVTGTGIAVLVAVVASVVAFAGSTGSSRLAVRPLTGYPAAQLHAIRVPLASLHGKIAQIMYGIAADGHVTGYEFRNARNRTSPVCLGAMDAGTAVRNGDPVQDLKCDLALNEIWFPAQWEEYEDKITSLINGEYPSYCLNVNPRKGQGSPAQLWDCYPNSSGPNGLAVNEAWDFGDWYTNVKSGISAYPIFFGSGDYCLNAGNENGGTGKNNEVPAGTVASGSDYDQVAAGQYWS